VIVLSAGSSLMISTCIRTHKTKFNRVHTSMFHEQLAYHSHVQINILKKETN
jgi:hypothetical protein